MESNFVLNDVDEPDATNDLVLDWDSSARTEQDRTGSFQLKNDGELQPAAGGSDEMSVLDNAMAFDEPEKAANSEMSSLDMSVSQTAITMPGLQPSLKNEKGLPSSWSNCTLSGAVPFCLVMLSKQSWEFQSILTEITGVGMTVKKIERIENRDLWETFEFERRKMEKNKTEVNEVYLFHGTSADKDSICQEGLDQRLSRIGYFGRGIYFSNDPRKCLAYTESDKSRALPSTCTVFKCRVLLGNMKVYPAGEHDKNLKREPLVENPEPGGPKYYDSVQGHVKDFDEFILYKGERVMPEYAISCYLPSSDQDSVADQTSVADQADMADQKGNATGEDSYVVMDEEKHAELEALRKPPRTVGEGTSEDSYVGMDEEAHAELEALGLPPKTVREGTSEAEDLYSSSDEEEVHYELKAKAQQQVPGSVAGGSADPQESANKEEVSAELAAGARGKPLRTHSQKAESEGEQQEKLSAELQAQDPSQIVPQSVESKSEEMEENILENMEEEDVYEQIHQMEMFAAMKASLSQGQDRRLSGEEARREQEQASGIDDGSGFVINHLDHEGASGESTSVIGGSQTTRNQEQQPDEAQSKMEIDPHSSGKTSGETDMEVNCLYKNRRHKKEVIHPDFLPVILQVREKVRLDRLKEKEAAESKKKTSTQSVPTKEPKWTQQEAAAPAMSLREQAEQSRLLSQVRDQVLAGRRKDEMENECQRKKDAAARQHQSTNSTSPVDDWKEESISDSVKEVLDVLIVQFMDVTACEDIEEARNFVLNADMDVNKAIISYINS